MKAARWVELGRVVCEDAPPPPPLVDGEVLVRTAYSSICGSDLHQVYLNPPPEDSPPGYPCHESVGEVVESRFPGLEPGDNVLIAPPAAPASGRCLAELQNVGGAFCIKLPDSAPLSHLLMAQQLGTVIFALRYHPIDYLGKDVAIIGQGSAGVFFTFLLRQFGASRIYVSDKSPARLAYGRQLGADLAVDASAGDGVSDFHAAVMDATGGRGADVVVEAVGSRETFPLSVELAARGAHLIWFGLPEGTGPYPFSFGSFFRKGLTAYSNFGAQTELGLESFRHAVRLITSGAIDVSPLLSHALPIEDVEQAFRIAHDRTENALKVSIKF